MSWREKPIPERDADFLFTWDEVDISLTDMDEGLTNIEQLPQDHPLLAAYMELLDINMDGPIMLHDIETASRRDRATAQFFRPELDRKSYFPNYQNIMKFAAVQEIVRGLVGFRTLEEAMEDGAAKLESFSMALDRANGVAFGTDFVRSSRNGLGKNPSKTEKVVITHAIPGRGQTAFTDSSEYYEIYDFLDDLGEAIDWHEAEH